MFTCHLLRSFYRVNNIHAKIHSHNAFLIALFGQGSFCEFFHYRSHNTTAKMAKLESLKFDNLVLKKLPVDKKNENFTRTVSGACFSLVKPTPVENPQTVLYSKPAMKLLDLLEEELNRKEFAEYFSGNKILPGSETASHCYCGHQFGYFSGQLGDGAAIYLGEVINSQGERWEIQLKGAGKTPYSRHADGRKVLRSSIREFLCSEAMHSLGIPTTRAGCCITSDSTVIRDIFYSGNPIHEKCTIVLRIAQTFIRFGSFEIFKAVDKETGRQGPSVGRADILETLLQYVIESFYPEIWEIHHGNKEDAYLAFYQEIVHRTARLVAQWQGVGFCHGVLNTDNMSIVGVTIDYGPYGFMDKYDPTFICNASDDGGRYTYEKQPEVCKWNCMKLAECLEPLVPMEKLTPILETYDEVYEEAYHGLMRRKLGLLRHHLPEDKALVEELFKTMAETGADFTNIFRGLSKLPLPGMTQFKDRLEEVKAYFLSQCCTLEELRRFWRPRMDPRQLNTMIMLMQMNPDMLAQLGVGHRGISQELDRIEKTKELQNATEAEKNSKDTALWSTWLEKYGERLRKEEESEGDLDKVNMERVKVMNETNPRVVLRNYIAQQAIDKAEKGDYSEVRRVLKVLEQPYSENVDLEGLQGGVADMSVQDSAAEAATSDAQAGAATFVDAYDRKPPQWATDLKVT